jgi:threonine dehydrogenase-like Zn-dependent dehydrogenase
LRRIPAALDDDGAATAEPLAVAVHGVRLLGTAIGLLALQAARLTGATTTLVLDVDPARLEVARRLGATLALDPRAEQGSGDGLARTARELTGGDDFDAAVDAVGRGDTRAAALRVVRPGGTVVWVGLAQDEVPVRGQELVLSEKRIQGAYGYTDDDFSTAISLLAAGRIETASWSRVYPLREGAALIGRLLAHQEPCIKALLDPAA